ncbi:outer membrane protein assembly factor BamB family protein [Rhodopirellula bahusiensis]|uniref:Pyrrolo-quinoline quinone n=1 Tax=Rhodopirellula bahusiensis TaxID=2014065 RepID=A0A2G1W1A5_9BACT|nr:PQQ-binding-like beta-propeller repeat protein [Rhodopirellula bahusiensis]PHQ32650.1 pyrrolo-quinoline quinone [Rhodopirellula bahusiensis]
MIDPRACFLFPSRRFASFLAVALALVTFPQGWAESPLTQPNWPRFLNDDFSGSAKLTDSAPESIASLDWNDPPKFHWALEVGDGYGIGVVRGENYFHFDATEDSERIRKIDLATGAVRWSRSYPLDYRDMYGYETGPRCSPTIAEQSDDFGDAQIFTYGVAGQLTVWSCDSGEQQWTVNLNEKYDVVQNFFGVGSAPLIIGDQVIVMVGGSPEDQQSLAPGRLDRVVPQGTLMVSLDRATGEILWTGGDDLASYSSPRTITVDGKQYLLMFARDHLWVLDPTDGKSLGKVYHRADILESVNAIIPVVDGNRVLISDCYDAGSAVYDIAVKDVNATFETVWKDPVGRRRSQSLRSHMSTPILHEGNLYACSGRNAPDSDFRCVDFATGEVKWTALDRRRSTATRFGDVLLVLRETGSLHIIRATPDQFEELAVWELESAGGDRPALQFPCWSAPVLIGNRMLIRGDRTVLCLSLPEHDPS